MLKRLENRVVPVWKLFTRLNTVYSCLALLTTEGVSPAETREKSMEKFPAITEFRTPYVIQTNVYNCSSLVTSDYEHVSKVYEVNFHKYHLTKQLQDLNILNTVDFRNWTMCTNRGMTY